MVVNKGEEIEDEKIEDSLLLNMPGNKITKYATETTQFKKKYNYFHVMNHTEPHTIRRKALLEKYPQIEKLFKKDPLITLSFVILIHIIQLFTCFCFYFYDISFKYIFIYALFIGAIFNHGLFVLYHDITHFNCFYSQTFNQLAAIFTNLPQIIPSAIGFGRYHRDHHSYLGDSIKDPDIPTVFEINLLQTKLTRLFYILFMPLFYGLRPYFKAPKSISLMEALNIISCLIYSLIIFKCFSIYSIYYLLLCTWFGLSVHPVGAHVIAEHYEYFKSQDTYSYYGWINWVNFNMGYHIEHHDFPNIAWHKLPELRKIAPEFYDTLPQMDSYVKVILIYIFDGSIGPWSRITLDKIKN